MIVSLIVAVSTNGVIGKNNDLIWNLPNDMMFFKKTTMLHSSRYLLDIIYTQHCYNK